MVESKSIGTPSAGEQLRTELKMRQHEMRLYDREMAEKLGISVATWGNIARGKTRITPRIAQAAARAFVELGPLAQETWLTYEDWRRADNNPETRTPRRHVSRERTVA